MKNRERRYRQPNYRSSLTSRGVILSIFALYFLYLVPGVSAFNFEGDGVKIISPLESNGAIPVNIQDQVTRPFDLEVNQISSTVAYSLTVSPTVDTYLLQLNTTTGLVAGDNIAFLEQNGIAQIFFGEIISINGNNITMDTKVPYNFTPSDTYVFEFNNDLSVDGSTNTQVFGITNFFQEDVDVIRFIFHCTDDAPMDNEKFCGLPRLTRGITLRKRLANGNFINYWNIKSNGDWSELAFDKAYDDKAPAGFYGFSARLTYGGQDKHGVAIRLAEGESIELLVQDDLRDLQRSLLMVEGHFVQN